MIPSENEKCCPRAADEYNCKLFVEATINTGAYGLEKLSWTLT